MSKRHGRQPRQGSAPPRGRDRRDGREEREAPTMREQFVAILDRRGRFLQASPFFERGRRIVVDRVRNAGPGDLVLVKTGRATRP